MKIYLFYVLESAANGGLTVGHILYVSHMETLTPSNFVCKKIINLPYHFFIRIKVIDSFQIGCSLRHIYTLHLLDFIRKLVTGELNENIFLFVFTYLPTQQ